MTRVVVIGGGFTGAIAAIHLARQATAPLDIQVIEPRSEVGRGVAFSATDPDHRLNSLANLHVVYPEDPLHFEHWLEQVGRLDSDPDIRAQNGSIIARRSDFGDYMREQFAAHVAGNSSGSKIRHVRNRALAIRRRDQDFLVEIEDGSALVSELVIVATNNEQPATLEAFASLAAERHPRYIANPWEMAGLSDVEDESQVLIIGAGLTAADVAATVLRDKPKATIDVISRSGIRPASRVRAKASAPLPLWDRINQVPSLFEQKHGKLTSVQNILMALRCEIRELEALGKPWQLAFDDVRDSARTLWMQLPLEEKKRFQRHLRRRYDSCRFRHAPQTEEIVDAAVAGGRLRFHRGRILRASAASNGIEVVWYHDASGGERSCAYQAVVNCTGPATRPDKMNNPLLQSMIANGIAIVAPLGIGLDVDEHCRVISATGEAQSGLYAFGALTFATFGYALAGPFIVDQVVRVVPDILSDA